MKTADLFDLKHTLAGDYLRQFTYPWEALSGIGEMILAIGRTLPQEEYDHPRDWEGNVLEDVWAAKDAVIFKTAYLRGPCIIGRRSEVRQCAFIRGSVLIGAECVVGNSTELKNVILFDGVQVPHYNYVGDSILGYKAHMGAGAITSNVKSDKRPVVIRSGAQTFETGRKKVGAMLGDRVEVGCSSVLNPGSILGPDCSVYPTSCVRGTVPPGHIWKNSGEVVPRR